MKGQQTQFNSLRCFSAVQFLPALAIPSRNRQPKAS